MAGYNLETLSGLNDSMGIQCLGNIYRGTHTWAVVVQGSPRTLRIGKAVVAVAAAAVA